MANQTPLSNITNCSSRCQGKAFRKSVLVYATLTNITSLTNSLAKPPVDWCTKFAVNLSPNKYKIINGRVSIDSYCSFTSERL